MRNVVVAVMVCALLAGLSAQSQAGIVLKYGHVGPPKHGQHIGALAFADYVKEKTNGAIEVQVFPMGQLGGERSMVEQVQTGTLDVTACTTAVLSNWVPQVALFDLPFLWPSREVAYKVLGDGEFQEVFFDLFTPKGLVAIGYTENEMRDLTNTKRDVRKPEDLRGLKIRVMESPVYLDTFRELGANPVPMPFPEIYNALQQGVIDAQDNPIFTSYLMKFIEVTKYATITQHILTECVTVINADLWRRLSLEEQKIFRGAADVQIKVNRETGAAYWEMGLQEIKKQGVKVIVLTPDERAVFRQAVLPVHKKYAEKAGYIPKDKGYGKYAGMGYYDMMQEKIKECSR